MPYSKNVMPIINSTTALIENILFDFFCDRTLIKHRAKRIKYSKLNSAELPELWPAVPTNTKAKMVIKNMQIDKMITTQVV